MTRKHFEAFAAMVRQLNLSPTQKEELISSMINTLRQLNPRFDSRRFRDACYGKDED